MIDRGLVPIKIERIIELLGLDIVPTPGLRSPFSAGVEGLLTGDRSAIHVDNDSFNDPGAQPRLRFTLAEELGHYVLHEKCYEQVTFTDIADYKKWVSQMDDNDYKWFERQAKEFAGQFLVPVEVLEVEMQKIRSTIIMLNKKYQGFPDKIEGVKALVAAKLCPKFHVSSQVIETRIRLDGLENYLKT